MFRRPTLKSFRLARQVHPRRPLPAVCNIVVPSVLLLIHRITSQPRLGTLGDTSGSGQDLFQGRPSVAVPASLGSAGVPRETFDRARARIAAGAGTRPSRAEGRFWELAGGGMLRCGECGGTMRARSVKRRKGREGEYTDFHYTCGNAFQKRGCTHTTLYRAPATEHEVMLAVDDVLADPDRITRDVESAIQKEKRAARDPDAKARTLAADREKLVRGYAARISPRTRT